MLKKHYKNNFAYKAYLLDAIVLLHKSLSCDDSYTIIKFNLVSVISIYYIISCAGSPYSYKILFLPCPVAFKCSIL